MKERPSVEPWMQRKLRAELRKQFPELKEEKYNVFQHRNVKKPKKVIKNMKIEIAANIDTDELKYSLQNTLSTKQLVKFAIDLSVNLTDEVEYLRELKKQLNKMNLDV